MAGKIGIPNGYQNASNVMKKMLSVRNLEQDSGLLPQKCVLEHFSLKIAGDVENAEQWEALCH